MMNERYGGCSIMKEISRTEDAIKTCYDRISSLEKRLIGSPDEENIEKELMECRKLLKTNEELLSTLHGHNRGNFVFAFAVCLVIFVVWMLYILIKGNEF